MKLSDFWNKFVGLFRTPKGRIVETLDFRYASRLLWSFEIEEFGGAYSERLKYVDKDVDFDGDQGRNARLYIAQDLGVLQSYVECLNNGTAKIGQFYTHFYDEDIDYGDDGEGLRVERKVPSKYD